MKTLLRILGFTAVETAGLSLWLALAHGASYVAAAVLFAFLLVEHILNVNTALKAPLGNLDRLGGILGFTAVETAAWVAWLAVVPGSPSLAAVILAALLLLEHNITDNVVLKRSFFTKLLDTYNLGHTLVEVTGAAAWFMLVKSGHPVAGVATLFGALFLHHSIAIALAQKAVEEQK
jgi:hypothetical protein